MAEETGVTTRTEINGHKQGDNMDKEWAPEMGDPSTAIAAPGETDATKRLDFAQKISFAAFPLWD